MTDSDLTVVACPQCGAVGSLQLTERLVAKPIGTFSLAGAQMKVSAVSTPALACSNCDFVKLPKRA